MKPENPENNDFKNMAIGPDGEAKIAVDGFGQVIEMLKIADPGFRESLLKRLALKDKNLANDLRRKLTK